MRKYQIDFVAHEVQVGGIEIEMEPDLDLTEDDIKDAAVEEISLVHPELTDIEITKISEVA